MCSLDDGICRFNEILKDFSGPKEVKIHHHKSFYAVICSNPTVPRRKLKLREVTCLLKSLTDVNGEANQDRLIQGSESLSSCPSSTGDKSLYLKLLSPIGLFRCAEKAGSNPRTFCQYLER